MKLLGFSIKGKIGQIILAVEEADFPLTIY